MADPVTVGKIAIKVASTLSDEEKRHNLIVTIIITIIVVVLLVLLVPIYFITAPLSAVKDVINGDISLSYIWDLRKAVWPDEDYSESSSDTSASGTQDTIYHGEFAMPFTCNAKITSLFGSRVDPVTGKINSTHTGLDFGVPTGTPISSAKDGTVTWAGNKGNGYGNYVIISHGNGYSTLYGHGSEVACKVGDVVTVGQIILLSGNTRKVYWSTSPF